MSVGAQAYFEQASALLARIEEVDREPIRQAASLMAEAIASGHWVRMFGSGHSVIPCMDIFPRYGSFVGFHPVMDSRLMWTQVAGSGGAPELIWIERQEGYIRNFLKAYTFSPQDVMLIYSHGGLNAAPVEVALYARSVGMKVVAVTSGENYRKAKATHSSGKKLGDLADVLIDNCVPLEDALVTVEGQAEKVAAGSTLAGVAISMALVAEVAQRLAERGIHMPTFVSPNQNPDPAHNEAVFAAWSERLRRSSAV